MTYDNRHDETVAIIRQELADMVSDDEQKRASAIATIAQAIHIATLAEPLVAEVASKVRDERKGLSQ